jgi:iron complex transport system ATP-binding protein
MIELQNVYYSYDNNPFIDNLSVAFTKGQITSIIGPNGSGKSTLLKLSSRLLKPRAGRVLLNERDVNYIKNKHFAQEVAVLLQYNYPTRITVENYVMAGRYPYQSLLTQVTRKDKSIVDQVMKQMGCDIFRGRGVNTLSGGERQRVYLAMALAQSTDIIFLDEPTTFLNINVSCEIMELIAKLNRDMGKTIIMVLHDLNLALNYSANVLLMQKGTVVAYDSAETIIKNNCLDRVFDVKTRCFSAEGKTYYCFDWMGSV